MKGRKNDNAHRKKIEDAREIKEWNESAIYISLQQYGVMPTAESILYKRKTKSMEGIQERERQREKNCVLFRIIIIILLCDIAVGG